MKLRILIVEDDASVRWSLAEHLRDAGDEVFEAGSLAEGRAGLQQDPDVLLLDLKLPDGDGQTLLEAARTKLPGLYCIVMSGHATVERDQQLRGMGAHEVFLKPFSTTELLLPVLEDVRELARLRYIEAQSRAEQPALPIARGAVMRRVEAEVEKWAPSNSKILLCGPSGSGKTFYARRIHELSGRKGNFVQANVCAIPAELIESELFGHEKGAFTDARSLKRGFFEQAHGGTLLLDEIGDMPLALQVKLLKAVEEGAITRLGAEQPTPVDVRLICATHRDLEALVRQGTFREDLFYRIHVGVITLPSLRERDPEDFIALAEATLRQQAREINKRFERIDPAAGELLYYQPWPGNIRELQNVLQRIVIHENGAALTADMVSAYLPPRPPATAIQNITDGIQAQAESAESFVINAPFPSLLEVKQHYMAMILRHCQGNLSRAAKMLAVSRRTLEREREMKRL